MNTKLPPEILFTMLHPQHHFYEIQVIVYTSTPCTQKSKRSERSTIEVFLTFFRENNV